MFVWLTVHLASDTDLCASRLPVSRVPTTKPPPKVTFVDGAFASVHSVAIKRGWTPQSIKDEYNNMKMPVGACGFEAFRTQTKAMVQVRAEKMTVDDDDCH